MRATMFNWDSKRVSRRFKKFPRMAIIDFLGIQSLVQLESDYTDEHLDDIQVEIRYWNGSEMKCKELPFSFGGSIRGIPMFSLNRELHRKIITSLES